MTVDLWGTLLLDPPGADNRYKARRLIDFDEILRGAGRSFSMATLDRACDACGKATATWPSSST